MVLLHAHLQYHNDTIIKTDARRLLYKYIYLSLYCKGSKRVTQGLRVRGSWRSNITGISWPLLLWPSALCLSCSPGLLNRRPRAHSAGWWLSLLHLISIFSRPQLIRAQMAPSAWCGFPCHISSITPSNLQLNWHCLQLNCHWLLSWLSYIIVQRPHHRPLDLWNRMFNRHQAEITVMQFRGHSLPVHQSMSVPWDFF